MIDCFKSPVVISKFAQERTIVVLLVGLVLFPNFFLLSYRPSKLAATRHLRVAKLADFPVIPCLYL